MGNIAIENELSLCITRTYEASPERIWRAWTEPEALKAWFHPTDTMTTPEVDDDVRVGGRYHIKMRSEDGEEHDVSGVYREVVPHEKLVFTWAWKTTPERESLVTVTLAPKGTGTELTLLHEAFFDEEARDQHESGWQGAMEQLEYYLKS